MRKTEGMTKKKPKFRFYCDKPACFTHYIANEKLKMRDDSRKAATVKTRYAKSTAESAERSLKG